MQREVRGGATLQLLAQSVGGVVAAAQVSHASFSVYYGFRVYFEFVVPYPNSCRHFQVFNFNTQDRIYQCRQLGFYLDRIIWIRIEQILLPPLHQRRIVYVCMCVCVCIFYLRKMIVAPSQTPKLKQNDVVWFFFLFTSL